VVLQLLAPIVFYQQRRLRAVSLSIKATFQASTVALALATAQLLLAMQVGGIDHLGAWLVGAAGKIHKSGWIESGFWSLLWARVAHGYYTRNVTLTSMTHDAVVRRAVADLLKAPAGVEFDERVGRRALFKTQHRLQKLVDQLADPDFGRRRRPRLVQEALESLGLVKAN